MPASPVLPGTRAARSLALVVSFALGCGGGTEPGGQTPPPPPPPPQPPGPPASIAVAAGDGQEAEPGTAVGTAPRIIVRDAAGRAVPNVAVTFAVDSGAGTLAAPTATTGADGIAAVGAWTLGPVEGRNVLKAAAGSLEGRIVATAKYRTAQLENESVSTGGGTVLVAGPGPLAGLRMDFPAGTFPTGASVTIGVASALGIPHHAQARIASPAVTITSEFAGFADQLFTITIPAKLEADEFPLVAFVDRTTGFLHGLQTTDFDATGVTALAGALRPNPVLPDIQPDAAARSGSAAVTAPFEATLVVLASKLVLSTLPYETGFVPGTDDWEFPQTLTTFASTGIGQVFTEAFYFSRRKAVDGKPLWDRFALARGVAGSNRAGHFWNAGVTRALEAAADRYLVRARADRAVDPRKHDSNTIRSLVFGMYYSGRPQPIIVAIDGDTRTQPVLAYGWNGLAGLLRHANPIVPGDLDQHTSWIAEASRCSNCTIAIGFPLLDDTFAGHWPKVLDASMYRDLHPATERVQAAESRGGLGTNRPTGADTLFLTRDTATIFGRIPSWPHEVPVTGATKIQRLVGYVELGPDDWEEAHAGSGTSGFVVDQATLRNSSTDGGVDRLIGVETRAVFPPVGDPTASRWADFTLYRVIKYLPKLTATLAPAGTPTSFTVGTRGGPPLPDAYRYRIDFGDAKAPFVGSIKPISVLHVYDDEANRTVKLQVIHPATGDTVARHTFPLELLAVTPKPLDGLSDTEYTLTADYVRPAPDGSTWVWDLGDPRLGAGRVRTTTTNSVKVTYPIDLGTSLRSHAVTVTLKNGSTTIATGHTEVHVSTIPKAWRFTSYRISFPTGSPTGQARVPAEVAARFAAEIDRWEEMRTDPAWEIGFMHIENDTHAAGITVPQGLYLIDGESLEPSALARGIRMSSRLLLDPMPTDGKIRGSWLASTVSSLRPAVGGDRALDHAYAEIGVSTAGLFRGVDWLHFYTLGHNGAVPDDYFPTDLRMAQVAFAGSEATGSFIYLVRQYTGGSRPPSFEERRWEVRVDFEARRIE